MQHFLEFRAPVVAVGPSASLEHVVEEIVKWLKGFMGFMRSVPFRVPDALIARRPVSNEDIVSPLQTDVSGGITWEKIVRWRPAVHARGRQYCLQQVGVFSGFQLKHALRGDPGMRKDQPIQLGTLSALEKGQDGILPQ